jgi:hypothetical protein
MPHRGHLSGLRACSAGHSDSETRSESDSDAGQHPPAGLRLGQVSRIIRAPVRVDTRVTCPGCGLDFANLDILKDTETHVGWRTQHAGLQLQR